MPLFGAHMSIAGGLQNSLLAAQKYGCETLQLFTASPSRWPVSAVPAKKSKAAPRWEAKDLPAEQVQQFLQALRDSKLRQLVAHDCYMINLASPEPDIFRRSVESFVVEMQRAEALDLSYLVMHPGAAVDGDEKAGLMRVALALDEVHERCAGFQVRILLETTAGQGTTLGHRFEHLGDILEKVKHPDLLGVCLDTCHVFAAGYPLAPEKEYRATFKEFDRLVGLKNLQGLPRQRQQEAAGQPGRPARPYRPGLPRVWSRFVCWSTTAAFAGIR